MYNRYIPTEDGSFRRQVLPEAAKSPAPLPPAPPPGPSSPPRLPEHPESIPGFFNNLLPKGLDTEDLIVILLLLLMSENCQDTPNTALVTMLIYLFL